MADEREPPRWAGPLLPKRGRELARATPDNAGVQIFGALYPLDDFEAKLAKFAADRGIDIRDPGGRQFALEIAARGNPKLAQWKRERGRPRKSNALLRAIEPAGYKPEVGNLVESLEKFNALRRKNGQRPMSARRFTALLLEAEGISRDDPLFAARHARKQNDFSAASKAKGLSKREKSITKK